MKRTMDAEGVGSACVSLHDGSHVRAAGGEDGAAARGEKRGGRVYFFLDIPNASLRRSRERLRLILAPSLPTFVVLVFLESTVSVCRDASIGSEDPLRGERGGRWPGFDGSGSFFFHVVSRSHFEFVVSHLWRRSSTLVRRGAASPAATSMLLRRLSDGESFV